MVLVIFKSTLEGLCVMCTHVDMKRQVCGVRPCRLQGLNLGHQAWPASVLSHLLVLVQGYGLGLSANWLGFFPNLFLSMLTAGSQEKQWSVC